MSKDVLVNFIIGNNSLTNDSLPKDSFQINFNVWLNSSKDMSVTKFTSLSNDVL